MPEPNQMSRYRRLMARPPPKYSFTNCASLSSSWCIQRRGITSPTKSPAEKEEFSSRGPPHKSDAISLWSFVFLSNYFSGTFLSNARSLIPTVDLPSLTLPLIVYHTSSSASSPSPIVTLLSASSKFRLFCTNLFVYLPRKRFLSYSLTKFASSNHPFIYVLYPHLYKESNLNRKESG